jgi:hypothetical protein
MGVAFFMSGDGMGDNVYKCLRRLTVSLRYGLHLIHKLHWLEQRFRGVFRRGGECA